MRASSPVWVSFLVIVLTAVVVYAIVKLRRARSEHRARSDERATAMMLALHQETRQAKSAATATGAAIAPAAAGSAPVVTASGAASTAARPQPARASAPAAPAAMVRKPRILTDTQHLLYLALRSAMPDHTLMVNIRIVDLLDVPDQPAAIERDTRLRELLRERADVIVCNADLVPVAALVIYEAGIQAVPDERTKVEALREMGVKFLRFRADNLPRPAQLRVLILG